MEIFGVQYLVNTVYFILNIQAFCHSAEFPQAFSQKIKRYPQKSKGCFCVVQRNTLE
jgi:hypothetical protein